MLVSSYIFLLPLRAFRTPITISKAAYIKVMTAIVVGEI